MEATVWKAERMMCLDFCFLEDFGLTTVMFIFPADIMIKPDGVQRGIVGEIIKRFEQKGYKLVAMKLTAPGKEHMEKHYADLSSKGFFAGLISYMTSGPVIAMVWEGKNAVLEGRCVEYYRNGKNKIFRVILRLNSR